MRSFLEYWQSLNMQQSETPIVQRKISKFIKENKL